MAFPGELDCRLNHLIYTVFDAISPPDFFGVQTEYILGKHQSSKAILRLSNISLNSYCI